VSFSDETKAALGAKLSPANVKTRKQGGATVSYVEGWAVIAEANRIFGFDKWTRETIDIKCVAESARKIGVKENFAGYDGWGVTYLCKARVIVDGVAREGCGAGHGIDRDLGQAHESAIKEAETDAMKRALMTFGNPFGLALYDKDQAQVADAEAARPAGNGSEPPKSSRQAKADGDWPKVTAGIAECSDSCELLGWGAGFPT